MEIKFVIIRHGETVANAEHLVDGHFNSDLSAKGREQVKAAGVALKDFPFAAVYSSDLNRTLDTAEAIIKENSHFRGHIRRVPKLRERFYGECEGWQVSKYKQLKGVQEEGRRFTPQGGETLEQVEDRVKTFLLDFLQDYVADAAKNGGGTSDGKPPVYLIVSHGYTISMLVKYLVMERGCTLPFAMSELKERLINMANTGIGEFQVTLSPTAEIATIKCSRFFTDDHLKK